MAQDRSKIEIRGKIIDFDSRQPIQGVKISIEGIDETTTDELGEYTFNLSNIEDSNIKLIYRYDSYITLNKQLKIGRQSVYRLDMEMINEFFELDDDIVVTANRLEEKAYEIPAMISIISAVDVKEKTIAQTPELLRDAAGVNVQKTNQGGGSPIIRGLKSNRLLLMVDGIRMNNSTYRGGNFQYLNTIDAELVERIEVVHGPNAVMYGSDALGGVVHAISKKPDISPDNTITGAVNSQISTADETKTINGNLVVSHPGWAAMVSGGYKNFGNVRRGDNGGRLLMQRLSNDSRTSRTLSKVQAPNNYWAYDFNSLVRIRPDDKSQIITGYQRNRQIDVPRYDVIETQTDSLRLFSPQERDLLYLRYFRQTEALLYDNISTTISWHRQSERRRRIRKGGQIESVDRFGVNTLGFSTQLNNIISDRNRLNYGMDVYFDYISSASFQQQINTNARTPSAPLFPDGSMFIQHGWYIQNSWTPTSSWKISPGIRYSGFRLRAPFSTDPSLPVQFGTLKQSTRALTGSLGIKYALIRQINMVGNLAQGFRTPNMDDASKLGPGKGGTIYEVPNPDLKPERSISVDGGLKVKSKYLEGDLIGFYNRINDVLIRTPVTLNGSPVIVDQGDTLSVFHKENAGQAMTAGFDINARIILNNRYNIRGRINYTYGQNISDNEPLSGIPPVSGFVEAERSGEFLTAHISFRFAQSQTRLSSEDKIDLRIPEGGTPGWQVFNIQISRTLNERLSFSLALNNITDRNYREHLSGLNAPGRNIILSLRSQL